MNIFNTSSIIKCLSEKNFYSHTRIKNLFNGIKGQSKKREVQEVRSILKKGYQYMDAKLAKIEKEIEKESKDIKKIIK